MHVRLTTVASAAAALVLAACATDTVAPKKVPHSVANIQAGTSQDGGDFLVLMKGESIDPGFEARVKGLGGKVKRRHDASGVATVSGLTEAAAAQLATSADISEVKHDVPIRLNLPLAPVQADASSARSPRAESQSNPALASRFSWQWNMRLIGADKAWAARKLGSSQVTVAILDTGIDYDAPDLDGLVDLSRSHSFMDEFVPATATSPIRPSDDEVTRKFFRHRNPISDYNGHGTNVATQVSSKARATAGVTSKTTLIGVKVLGSNSVGSLSGVLDGVLWAADHGANVANMSLGGAFDRVGNDDVVRIIERVFNYAQRKRMLVVVSAGNDGEDLDNNGTVYQAYCDAPHVVCVSSVGPIRWDSNPDEPSFFTNFGTMSIDVAGPGGNADAAHFNPITGFPVTDWPWGPDIASWVWSFCSKTHIFSWTRKNQPDRSTLFCEGGNLLDGFVGTSQASPHVAGLAALIISLAGESRFMDVKKMIEESADDLGPRGRDPFYGAGRINVWNAVRRLNSDGNGTH